MNQVRSTPERQTASRKLPKWITVNTAAGELGISPRSIYRLVAAGALIGAKFRGSLRILTASLRHYEQAMIAAYLLENGIELGASQAAEIEKL